MEFLLKANIMMHTLTILSLILSPPTKACFRSLQAHTKFTAQQPQLMTSVMSANRKAYISGLAMLGGSDGGFMRLNKFWQASGENPPFFPRNIAEIASDASFSTKIALISSVSRIRIDVRTRLTESGGMLQLLILYALEMLEGDGVIEENSAVDGARESRKKKEKATDERSTKKSRPIRIFLETEDDMARADKMLTYSISGTKWESKGKSILLSKLTESDPIGSETLFIIYNPNNVDSARGQGLLEDVEAICFHGALRGIPVVIFNPVLIATAWNNFGPRPPMLLSDFAQCYFICDDYFMMARRDQWCGLVQRASSGMDVYLLSGFHPGKKAAETFLRIEVYPDGIPSNLRRVVAQQLLQDPCFPDLSVLSSPSAASAVKAKSKREGQGTFQSNRESRWPPNPSSVGTKGTEQPSPSSSDRSNLIKVQRGGQSAYYSWRSIKPPPTGTLPPQQ